MKILVIGSGGREHALCWKLSRSPLCRTLYCAPGNGGISEVAECVSLDPVHHDAVIAFCRDKDITLVVIGPEIPLVNGLADSLQAAGIRAFGPSAAAARLEGSKGFTKDLCARHGIPTAAYGRFDNEKAALAYLMDHPAPIVIKADGLAAGKGVIIAETDDEARQAVSDLFAGAFGEAGAEVVIEEFLTGEEASFFALVDGRLAVPLTSAQDHKRVGDGDTGPNTGGMGAYSPAPVLSNLLQQRVMAEIIQPTVAAMAAEGSPFVGVLYAGLMLTQSGPKLIEYNVRFGDPECQVIMLRLQSDLAAAMVACTDGALDHLSLDWDHRAALTVVMAAKGYPGSYEKGTQIGGVEAANSQKDVVVFHAGTQADGGRLLATGGRVLNVTALGETVSEAQGRAYEAVAKIDWPEGFCRQDIGWREIAREKGGTS